jgi:hypothetical protein
MAGVRTGNRFGLLTSINSLCKLFPILLIVSNLSRPHSVLSFWMFSGDGLRVVAAWKGTGIGSGPTLSTTDHLVTTTHRPPISYESDFSIL